MYQKQMKALRQTIAQASNICGPEKAIKALTAIIEETLITNNKDLSIAAILFLKNDERGDVYYRRAYYHEQLAKKYQQQGNDEKADFYFERSTIDTQLASKAYDDIEKIKICRRDLQDDQARIVADRQEKPIHIFGKKRTLEESDSLSTASTESNTPPKYFLRAKRLRIWAPQVSDEETLNVLDQNRKGIKKG